ncbi:uncharacterized protein LOC110677102 isoform X1 [Aedes aegypti]|uniref:Uncharacterized protein n=2 Tax=Aedes aegypti TaxID=7159 RepID=A0A6I8U990_AEDAE|nr:uncharacterized protein LOC110677102 isoform X1 [Aedes aegypti]
MRWILFVILILPILSSYFFFPANGKHLEITDLKDNPGIVALKVGKAFVIQGYDWLVHTIKLDAFHEILQQYGIMINEIETNFNTKDIRDLLKLKFIQTNMTFQKLSFRKRSKRAINILGTLVKTITGNLDNNDLITLNQNINFLQNSNKNLIESNNQQIKINNQFEDRMNNLTRVIFNENKEIGKLTNQIRANNNIKVSWEQIQHFQRLIFNLDVVQRHLDDISDSIVMAKVGVLSKSILEATEIDYIIGKLEKAGISIISDEQVYEFLEPAAFYNGSCIVFLIKIPKFLQGPYQQIMVENIPINDEVIPIDFTHAVLGTNETFVVNDTCVNIEQNIMCKLHTMKNVSDDMCIHRLLRGNPSSCPFKKYNIIREIKSIGSGKILIKNAHPTVQLKNSCGFGPKNLTGSLLITFRNCSIQVDNKSFENTQFEYSNTLEILPLQSTLINKSKTITTETQTLQELHINNRKRIEFLETTNSHVSYGGTFTMLIFLIIFLYLFKEIRTIWTKIVIKASTPTTSNIELNRGGSS